MRKAGAADRKIQFLQATVTANALGNEVETFAPVGFAWASVTFGSGSERREAASISAEQSIVFRVLSNSMVRAITRRDRIVFDGDAWGIKSISAVGPQGHEIEFGATFVEGR